MLERVTITGADDSVEISDLIDLSIHYPFVEWGILFSKTRQGQPRYPSWDWMAGLGPVARHARLSAHLCGAWVRALVGSGDFTWIHEDPRVTTLFSRVQLNFHAMPFAPSSLFSHRLVAASFSGLEFILQVDGVNDEWAKLHAERLPGAVVPLFDRSGGAGTVPEGWPRAWENTVCGYAGGLGPNTLATELPRIASAAAPSRRPYWIDMETRVRTPDDARLDLDKVDRALAYCAPFITQARV